MDMQRIIQHLQGGRPQAPQAIPMTGGAAGAPPQSTMPASQPMAAPPVPRASPHRIAEPAATGSGKEWLRNYMQALGAGLATAPRGNSITASLGAGLYGSTAANAERRASEQAAALAADDRRMAIEDRERDAARSDAELQLKQNADQRAQAADERDAVAADYQNLKTSSEIRKLEAEGARRGLSVREMLEVERLTNEYAKRLKDSFVEADQLDDKMKAYREELIRRSVVVKQGGSATAPRAAPTATPAPATESAPAADPVSAPTAAPSAAPSFPSGRTVDISEGRTATNPQTGEKLIYRNGTWQPLG